MSGIKFARSRLSSRASRLVARALLALLCLLTVLGGPGPVLCLESDGACDGEQSANIRPMSCHDQAPARIPDCASCTDVAAPEESALGANHPESDQESPIVPLALERMPVVASAPVRPAPSLFLFRSDPALAFVRTTVLLI